MNVPGILENGLFALSQVLRLPVILLLWVCVAAALFMAGGCVSEFLVRRRERTGFTLNSWLEAGPVLGVAEARQATLPAPLKGLLTDVEREHRRQSLSDGGLEHVVLEREEQVRRTLNGSRMLVRVGPSLGLLGTLIPMGTALAVCTKPASTLFTMDSSLPGMTHATAIPKSTSGWSTVGARLMARSGV